jgi:hypothetical protein
MMAKKKWLRLTVAIVGALMLIGVSSAQAATVDLESFTAVRINNLEVAGTFYNVTFTAGTWPEAYGGQPPQLDVTQETAPAFVEGINEALTLSPARTVGEPGDNIDAGFYMIGTNWDDQQPFGLDWLGGFYADRSGAWLDGIDANKFGGKGFPGDTPSMWVNIAPVPIPAAVWLLGGGLIGLLGLRRRFKN